MGRIRSRDWRLLRAPALLLAALWRVGRVGPAGAEAGLAGGGPQPVRRRQLAWRERPRRRAGADRHLGGCAEFSQSQSARRSGQWYNMPSGPAASCGRLPKLGSPRKPDAHLGRCRTRFSRLSAFALLLAAFGLFAAAPAQAQTATPPVTNLSVASYDEALHVTWTNPSGSGTTGIRMRFRAQGTTTWQDYPFLIQLRGTRSTYIISSLTNGTTYDVEVQVAWVAISGGTPSTGSPSSWASTVGTPHRPIWHARLSVETLGVGVGCDNSFSGAECSRTTVLRDDNDDFT